VNTVTVDLEIITESIAAVDSETINDTASTADVWIRQRKKTLLTLKSQAKTESLPSKKPSMRLPSKLKPVFVRAYSSVDL
jgi:hypothetical protein